MGVSLPGCVGKMSPVPKVGLSGGLEICRILNGMWQVSGGHGVVDPTAAGTRGNVNLCSKNPVGYSVLN